MEEMILASGSPRRSELLAQIGIPFRVVKSNAPEIITKKDPAEIVEELSAQKAAAVAESVQNGIILGADTIVTIDGEILGKPTDRRAAAGMLKQLSGRAHAVFTGVTLIRKKDGKEQARRNFYRKTLVYVHEMSEQEMNAYLDTGDGADKAGSYGIQGPFAAYIDRIEGDYNNVVGLPIAAVYQELKDF